MGAFPLPFGNFSKFPTSQNVQPDEPACISGVLNFTAAQQYVAVDFSSDKRMADFALQGVFIDNSLNAQAVTLTFQPTGQVLTIAANTQAYLPVVCPNPGQNAEMKLTAFSNAGGAVNVPIQLLNTPVTPCVWTA